MHRNLKPFGWLVIGAAALWVCGIFSQDPVVDALTGEPVADVGLGLPVGYIALAPFMGLLDHLSLLTDRQHAAVLLSIGIAFLTFRGVRRLSGACVGNGFRRECGLAALAVVSVVGIYAFGVLGTRPMVALETYDPEVVIVDFHSHTDSSHDGRPGFDAGARREWHSSAGFDLAYLTDHASLDAVTVAGRNNPARAGEGLSILAGREVRFQNQHVIVLGGQDPNEGIPPSEGWPTLIQTIPNDLSRVPLPTSNGLGGVHAIELVDADPRGLRQSVEERDLLLQIADSLKLTVVAGSNHHGWGRAAAAWNLMRVPGWEHLPPEELGKEIESLVRDGRSDRILVAERRRLSAHRSGEYAIAEILTAPRLILHILRSLTLPERLAWIGWAVVGSLGLAHARQARVD